MKDLVFKHTTLESSDNVGDCLSWKLESIKENNLPVDTGLADYIAFGVDNLDSQLLQLKAVKAEIAQREKALKSQIESIKVDGAVFLLENGLDKLDGVICSSVTITKAKEEKIEEITTKEVSFLITDAEIEELLIGLGKAEMVTVYKEKVTKAQPAKLRINKRKSHIGEL